MSFFTIDANALVTVVVGGIILLVINKITKKFTNISDKLSELTTYCLKQNGRIGKIETWTVEHEKREDDWQNRADKEFNSIWHKIDETER